MWEFLTSDLSNLGLTLDIIGAIFIFFFGMPKQPFFIRDDQVVVTNKEKSAILEKVFSVFFKFMEYAGLLLLIAGFALQIVSKIPAGT
ncbi:MAG: hypothetical protein ACOY9D_09025 [Pseudomonadota bacterium]